MNGQTGGQTGRLSGTCRLLYLVCCHLVFLLTLSTAHSNMISASHFALASILPACADEVGHVPNGAECLRKHILKREA